MKRYVFKSIYLKFVAVFVGVLWLSSTAAFFIGFHIVEDDLKESLRHQLTGKAKLMIEYNTKYSLEISDLMRLFSESGIEAISFKDISEIDRRGLSRLSDFRQEIEGLKAGEIFEGEPDTKKGFPFTAFKLGDEIIVLRLSPNTSIMLIVRSIIYTVLLICAGIGSLLIVIAARMVVRPIKRLTEATREVSKGNFDIQLMPTSRDEIGKLTSDFITMTQELKKIEYLRKDFISSVSHEFKTPITAIQGFAKLIKEKKLKQEQFDEYTDIIISETERLSNLSSSLLRLTQLENQTIYKSSTTFSIDEQLRRALVLLDNRWSSKEIDLDIDLEKIHYTGDEELLLQVWLNLLSNAIKFSERGGHIAVTARENNGIIRVEVADEGVGISEEDKKRVFEKFYKSDKSRSSEGNGLGLAIAKRIVEHSGGRISFESTLGVGTRFIVELKSI